MSTHGEPAVDGARTGTASRVPLAEHELRRSTEPFVVLSSLARASVPSFSDICALELSEGLEPVVRASYPADTDSLAAWPPGPGDPLLGAGDGRVVAASFELPAAFGHASCAGVVVFAWTTGAPDGCRKVLTRMLIDSALAVIRHERLAEAVSDAELRSARLAGDVLTSKSIGEAIGLVRATHQVGASSALGLLKAASRSRDRDLYEVALEVVHAGALSSSPVASAPARPARATAR